MPTSPDAQNSTPINSSPLGAYVVCATLIAAIFCVDMRIPLGIAIGSSYIVPVLLALWSRNKRFILLVAAVSSALVIFAWGYKSPVEQMGKVAFNRILALFTIWATAILCVRIAMIQKQLITIASYDFLTGIMNRREGLSRLQEELSRSQRFDKPFSVIMIDIDHFKTINDRYGHDAGDQVLKTMAEIFRSSLRRYDYVCRYGGEEFLVVAPATTLDVVVDLAERLRRTVSETSFSLPGHPAITVTVSAGVATCLKEESVSAVISRADGALYRAKEAGRNRVVHAGR